MKFDFEEFATIYNEINRNGVVLYGGGHNCIDIIEILKNMGITINAVADRNVGKK